MYEVAVPVVAFLVFMLAAGIRKAVYPLVIDVLISRKITRLRKDRLALLSERRAVRNVARAAREGGAALYVEWGGNND